MKALSYPFIVLDETWEFPVFYLHVMMYSLYIPPLNNNITGNSLSIDPVDRLCLFGVLEVPT
jgi:hypothetical protein